MTSGLGVIESECYPNVKAVRTVAVRPGHGFWYCAQQGLLGKVAVDTLQKLSSTIASYEVLATTSVSPHSPSLWDVHQQFASLLRRLDLDRSQTIFPPLEVAAFQVARLYVTRLRNLLTGSPCSNIESITSDIRASLSQASLNFQLCSNLGLFLWIFFSGCLLEPDNEFREWLKVECYGVICRLRFSDTQLEDMMEILSCFLWSTSLLGNTARKFWDEVTDLVL